MISTTTGRSPFCLRYPKYLRKLCIYNYFNISPAITCQWRESQIWLWEWSAKWWSQWIGRNEVLKSNVITNEERRDNGNGWDSRRCVDVFGRRRDWHVTNMMQSVDPYTSMKIYQRSGEIVWLYHLVKRGETSGIVGIAEGKKLIYFEDLGKDYCEKA